MTASHARPHFDAGDIFNCRPSGIARTTPGCPCIVVDCHDNYLLALDSDGFERVFPYHSFHFKKTEVSISEMAVLEESVEVYRKNKNRKKQTKRNKSN